MGNRTGRDESYKKNNLANVQGSGAADKKFKCCNWRRTVAEMLQISIFLRDRNVTLLK